MRKVVFFDLEGPLSSQDNAYEVLGLVPEGHKIFEVISKYDDILALERRPDYEAGDTLSLIAPFLVAHDIQEKDVYAVSRKAFLVGGARAMIAKLKEAGWLVYIISTSYEQHAYNIASQLGIKEEKVKCTQFPLDSYLAQFSSEDLDLVLKAEKEILSLYPPRDEQSIKERLDSFFFGELPRSRIGNVLGNMRVIGGQRKVEAMKELCDRDGIDVSDSIAVGDSITDMKMLGFVRDRGGLSVVFNGNEYALPYGSVGLATQDMRNLSLITSSWEVAGKEGVLEAVMEKEGSEEDPYYHVLEGRKSFEDVLEIHRKMRNMVRGEAGKLG